MERALNQLGQLVHAKDALKYGMIYTCPYCGAKVIKVEGKKQSPHFRHERGQVSENCELYIKSLTSSFNPNDYSTILNRPFITFEPSSEDWKLFIKFPYLTTSQAAKCDRYNLHFKIKCNEMNSYISSAQLWLNSSDNKLQIIPKNGYSFSFERQDYQDCYYKLGLNWPKYIQGFKNNIYLFQLINNEFCMMEPRELSLNDTFYMMSREKVKFPNELHVETLNKKYGWFAYKLQLPSLLTDELIGWFQQLGYCLKPPYYYLDILKPSTFGRKNNAILIEDRECIIQISFRDFTQQIYTLVHILPDYTSKEYLLSDRYFKLALNKEGFHTFYIKNHEGKMLHLYFGEKISTYFPIEYDSRITIDNQKLTLFKEKEIRKFGSINVLKDSLFHYWIKEKNKFPKKSDNINNYSHQFIEKIFIPGIWTFHFSSGGNDSSFEIKWNNILIAYIQFEQQNSYCISNEEYAKLKSLIKNINDRILQSKLTYYSNLYRNHVPVIVKKLIERVSKE
jgi:hypothetical protein